MIALGSSSDQELVVRLVSGTSDQPQISFRFGRTSPNVSVGTRAAWQISARGVAAAHAILAFDGHELFVRVGGHAHVFIDYRRIESRRWIPVPIGTTLQLGTACLAVSMSSPDALETLAMPPETRPMSQESAWKKVPRTRSSSHVRTSKYIPLPPPASDTTQTVELDEPLALLRSSSDETATSAPPQTVTSTLLAAPLTRLGSVAEFGPSAAKNAETQARRQESACFCRRSSKSGACVCADQRRDGRIQGHSLVRRHIDFDGSNCDREKGSPGRIQMRQREVRSDPLVVGAERTGRDRALGREPRQASQPPALRAAGAQSDVGAGEHRDSRAITTSHAETPLTSEARHGTAAMPVAFRRLPPELMPVYMTQSDATRHDLRPLSGSTPPPPPTREDEPNGHFPVRDAVDSQGHRKALSNRKAPATSAKGATTMVRRGKKPARPWLLGAFVTLVLMSILAVGAFAFRKDFARVQP